jgi:hypothetical protein
MRLLFSVCIAALCAPLATWCADEPPVFDKINNSVAIANQSMALQLKGYLWESADGVWLPKEKEVLRALRFLNSTTGKRQIVETAPPHTDMRLCVAYISRTRFQVYGFVIKNRKHLLFDSAPDVSAPQLGYSDRWLQESISKGTWDGGAEFWSAGYDCDLKRVVASGRRPD